MYRVGGKKKPYQEAYFRIWIATVLIIKTECILLTPRRAYLTKDFSWFTGLRFITRV